MLTRYEVISKTLHGYAWEWEAEADAKAWLRTFPEDIWEWSWETFDDEHTNAGYYAEVRRIIPDAQDIE